MGFKRSLLIPLLGLLIFLGWLVFYANTDVLDDKSLHMAEVGEKPVGGDFHVNSDAGEIALSDFKGRVVLLYFGYASCPDVCSTALSKMSLALQNLSQKERSQVKTLFISLDPEHDTVESLKSYVRYYHGSFIGATATKPELNAIAKQYGVRSRMVQKSGSLESWLDHTAYLYIIDTSGKLKIVLPHKTQVTEITTLIRETLAET